MSDKIGLFTGSFDPITNGHLDLIERASGLFDKLYVGVFTNPKKVGLLTGLERKAILEKLFVGMENIEVVLSENELVVDVARRYGVTHLVRGLRNATDLEYESSFDFYNRQLAPDMETIYLIAKPELKFVSSSQVRELLYFKQDIGPYVPEIVSEEIRKNEEK
ncbi:pantetheine-phosphate adenylyltransferase [Streptococcus suis]|uniref:pantetheine-phosphate adenylyltransferase n=1 Tax=Streptococcus suis TaxID=1307 RepID=UPI0005CDA328|nr:pantetheine-phosphate adenylyltransferase [Streptococcus suis]MCK3989551.1 pantetheine-phosphate adenylyltransferase [Streptococcus suis]MCO8231099.1 pantetheine-phosphate adenylyltransferase [Streptococcus suis]NQG47332.1 pantetheine-phosphate adenylyltransferase [Streptococcus suis]NQH62130.1 pantetheine-phosphate adenylyltransferase [Streptococcus suis]NQI09298.1 pantetheine-phosphate adenylyltransferase [Streptococcus suis]